MNLHISAPSVFIDTFSKNLVKLGLEKNNKIVLRSNTTHDKFSSAKLYSAEFNALTGKTEQYERVFIHQFNPLLYRWVAMNDFRELNWMVWGADLYNLQSLENRFYEPLTKKYSGSSWGASDFLYRMKVLATASPYKRKAYAKVDHVLTWMKGEFDFAKKELNLKASHKFFFYENQTSYQEIAKQKVKQEITDLPTYVLGNSATRTNNHLDALQFLEDQKIKANLKVPISYGDQAYARFLKQNTKRYTHGSIEFVDRFMSFNEYIAFLNSSDGLIMNTLRPQGYGNIFMMLSMDKQVYLNERNLSLSDLDRNNIPYELIRNISKDNRMVSGSAEAIENLFSTKNLDTVYRELFS